MDLFATLSIMAVDTEWGWVRLSTTSFGTGFHYDEFCHAERQYSGCQYSGCHDAKCHSTHLTPIYASLSEKIYKVIIEKSFIFNGMSQNVTVITILSLTRRQKMPRV
jgi:hypothetical protein